MTLEKEQIASCRERVSVDVTQLSVNIFSSVTGNRVAIWTLRYMKMLNGFPPQLQMKHTTDRKHEYDWNYCQEWKCSVQYITTHIYLNWNSITYSCSINMKPMLLEELWNLMTGLGGVLKVWHRYIALNLFVWVECGSNFCPRTTYDESGVS
jgi:hypothetical protein